MVSDWWFRVEYIDADKYALIIRVGTEEFRSETSLEKEEIKSALGRMLFD